MDINTYLTLDGLAMGKLVQERKVKPIELVECSIKLLERVNPKINAVAHDRIEKVTEEARQYTQTNAVFSGVPMFLKDTQALAGEKLTSGAKLFQHQISTVDSNLTRRFKALGCLFLGHSTTPEFALKNITEPELYGPTKNPWNTNYSPGGSSGGSAALIASGVVPISGASDGGGSIRIPASFTGLFGLKPSRGRTPIGPGVGRQWHGAAIDFILSRTVRDSAAMLDGLATVQEEAAFQIPLYHQSYLKVMHERFNKPLKIAFTTKSPVNTPVSEEAKQAVYKTVRWLEEQGHIVVEDDNHGVDGIQLMRDYYLMNSGEMATLISQLEKGLGRKLSVHDVEIETWILNEAGKFVTAAEFSSSLASWDRAAYKMMKFHKRYDFFLTPAAASTAPKVGELTHSAERKTALLTRLAESNEKDYQELVYEMFLPSLTYTPFTQLANLTGQPAMSVPVHLTDEQLPIGVQFIAPKGDEHQLLKIAFQMEQSDLWIGMKGNPYFEGIY